ncbi:hypothetical protein CYD53_101378 [Bosea psychrotolerans]|uniref:Uncharacterized protein n=1 Tax=Bosea psychrotolerans TaxID=1871628 RepID=A0A2S4MQ37_9HYPH|nr:hypothetical protein CYD53_101378 [Bosea psychrotolerans]
MRFSFRIKRTCDTRHGGRPPHHSHHSANGPIAVELQSFVTNTELARIANSGSWSLAKKQTFLDSRIALANG